VFQKLPRADVARIAWLMLDETRARVAAKGFQLHLTRPLVDAIIADGYSDEYGVRPLRQTIIRSVAAVCGSVGGRRAGDEDGAVRPDCTAQRTAQAAFTFMPTPLRATRLVRASYVLHAHLLPYTHAHVHRLRLSLA
jgi:hypothetical protein